MEQLIRNIYELQPTIKHVDSTAFLYGQREYKYLWDRLYTQLKL